MRALAAACSAMMRNRCADVPPRLRLSERTAAEIAGAEGVRLPETAAALAAAGGAAEGESGGGDAGEQRGSGAGVEVDEGAGGAGEPSSGTDEGKRQRGNKGGKKRALTHSERDAAKRAAAGAGGGGERDMGD